MSSNSASLGVSTIIKPLQNVQTNASVQKPNAPKAPSVENKAEPAKTDKENTNKGDTFIIAGKEIKKKDAVKYGSGAAIGLGTLIAASAAFKKGKIINGENSKFFSNISEGLKAIFTKAGKEKYQKAIENIANNTSDAASTASKSKKRLFKSKHKGAQNAPQAPVPTKEDVVKDLISEYNKGDKEAQKIVKDIVDNAQKRTLSENIDKIYEKMEPEIATILGDDFKNALIKLQKESGSISSTDAILKLGQEFSADELKKIMTSKDGSKKLVEYVQTGQVLSDAANASKKLLQSIINA